MSQSEDGSSGAGAKHPDHFVAEWREYRGLSQVELGKMLGASHSKVSRIESGETELKTSILKKLAKIFGAPIHAIIT